MNDTKSDYLQRGYKEISENKDGSCLLAYSFGTMDLIILVEIDSEGNNREIHVNKKHLKAVMSL